MNHVYDYDRRAISVQSNKAVKEHVKRNRKRSDLYQEPHYYFK